MGYAEDWQAAKDKFETATGLKKPAAKGSFLFVTWRKSSGIESALKAIDKFVAGKNWDNATEKTFKEWRSLIATLQQKMNEYFRTLDDSIKKEKTDAGKTDNYRHMKLLKATLDTIVSQNEQKAKMALERRKVQQEKGDKALNRIDAVLVTLRQLGNNVKAGTAQATKFCQEVLSDPTGTNWNRVSTDHGARRLSQALINIYKYVYADYAELLMSGTAKDLKEIEVLDDDRVAEQIKKLSIFLHKVEGDIRAMGEETGNSAMTGSLAKLANSPDCHLPANASKPTVVAAVKRLAGIVKKGSEISAQLLRFGQ